ncbi:MAG: PilN domain-containing protein [Candidatus Rifleibacteriota bacterium]
MIRVNLLTVKRRKPIQIPFAAIFFVIGLIGIGGGFYAGTLAIKDWNKPLIEEKNELKDEIAREQSKLDIKDSLRQQKNQLNSQINRLEQLSGANLLQWSQVFSDLTNVVPNDTVWITNLRIDSDRRVQIAGYSCSGEDNGDQKGAKLTRGIQEFIRQIQGHEHFNEVFLNSATKNVYEKKPVWRFEINCRITRNISDSSL